jgi:hypothetical protein
MKYFILLFLFIFSSAYGATCTTTTRSNYSTGQVLSSSSLNADFNQLVTKVNSLDGGCVTDGTLEASSLNATDFAAVINGIQQGCGLVYVDANTVGVGKCILSVNGTFVKTTGQTNVMWGCSSCSSEVTSTTYYIYAKTGSSGTTLNLLISTTAPNADGYDGSGNKVLGKFYNDSLSAINKGSLINWRVNDFSKSGVDNFTFSFGAAITTICSTSPCAYIDQFNQYVSGITRSFTGTYPVALTKTFESVKCWGNVSRAAGAGLLVPVNATGSVTSITLNTTAVDGATAADTYGTIHCEGY